MSNRLLLDSQKQTAIILLQDAGIDAGDMVFREEQCAPGLSPPLVHKLVHEPTSRYYFSFDFYDGMYRDQFSPGEHGSEFTKSVSIREGETIAWENRWEHFRTWAKYLKREIDAKDFLSSIGPSVKNVVIDATDNTPFTPQEQAAVIKKLDALEGRLNAQRDATAAQSDFIGEQFRLLKIESAKSGRRSWFHMALGVVVSILSSSAFGSQAAIAWQEYSIGDIFRIGE